jgi:hypothetical protein
MGLSCGETKPLGEGFDGDSVNDPSVRARHLLGVQRDGATGRRGRNLTDGGLGNRIAGQDGSLRGHERGPEKEGDGEDGTIHERSPGKCLPVRLFEKLTDVGRARERPETGYAESDLSGKGLFSLGCRAASGPW